MAYHTDVAKQRKKNGIQTERKADKLKKAPPKATRESIAVPFSTVEKAIRKPAESPRQTVKKTPSKQDTLDRWSNSSMTSKTTRTTPKLSRESQMSPSERNDRYGQIARARKSTKSLGEKTVGGISKLQESMYNRAFGGPPSKEEQERLRKENSRRAAQEAAARGLTGRGRR